VCVTAASEDKNNRSRQEKRSLRWVKADAETLCCAHVRSVLEITRETLILSGKNQGQSSQEHVIYLCSIEPDPARADEMLTRIRRYWDIESGLHQRLDVSGGEDSSRVRNRNAILVLGMMRRSVMGHYNAWRRRRKNLRQSTLKDYYDAMNRFNHRLAFATLTTRSH
jgi:predicted transposase YbfD/YdcC